MKQSKGLIAGVLALVVILALVFLYWVLRPLIVQPTPIVQPPALPSTVPNLPGQPATSTPTQPVKPTPSAVMPNGELTAQEKERQAEEALKRQAMDFAGRVGSYSNADEFASLKQVYVSVTPAVRDFLEGKMSDLAKQHPIRGSSWGQTSVAIAPNITAGLPLLSSEKAEVVVQVQVTIEDAGKTNMNYQETVISYTKDNGGWIVSRVTWRAITQP